MLLQEGNTEKQALQKLNLPSWCCNRMLLTHLPMIDQLLVRKGIDGKSTKRVIEAGGAHVVIEEGDEAGDDRGGDD